MDHGSAMLSDYRDRDMAKYLLDTTVLIDHLRGRCQVVELVTALAQAGNELGVCSINVAELYSGLSERHRTMAEKLIDNLEYWEATRETAKNGGELPVRSSQEGRGTHDNRCSCGGNCSRTCRHSGHGKCQTLPDERDRASPAAIGPGTSPRSAPETRPAFIWNRRTNRNW
ncbi:MAG: PIN domain-containing protein [Chloroflexi bacterium]|nr:PIN domain-containing protein [Chloroflexota bacterium]